MFFIRPMHYSWPSSLWFQMSPFFGLRVNNKLFINSIDDKIEQTSFKATFWNLLWLLKNGSSPPEVFLRKDILKTSSKFTGEHPCQSVKQLYWNRTLAWVFSCTLACVFSCKFAAYSQKTFPKNTFGWLLL